MEKFQEIERSIIKTYRKQIYRPFVKAVADYKLIEENDKVMVCISGGKDSFLLAKCIQELKKYWPVPFEARFVVMDPGYSEESLKKITDNAALMNIPIEIYTSRIFDVVMNESAGSPCYLCARMRRGALYTHAKEIGCNKIALGHHFSDVIETTMMSILYGAEVKTMLPKLHSDHFEGIDLIRPLYLVHEEAIENWRDQWGLSFINCACPLGEVLKGNGSSKRKEIKGMIRSMRKVNPNVEANIFKAMCNVNLCCVLEYHSDGPRTSFMDLFEATKSVSSNSDES